MRRWSFVIWFLVLAGCSVASSSAPGGGAGGDGESATPGVVVGRFLWALAEHDEQRMRHYLAPSQEAHLAELAAPPWWSQRLAHIGFRQQAKQGDKVEYEAVVFDDTDEVVTRFSVRVRQIEDEWLFDLEHCVEVAADALRAIPPETPE